ncbi:MAG: cupredoxin domain-containing protein [Thaumarchaeota archaeon]|nr:cupredoxin domain-containing protein [Nitrososphaerota archaeon]
MDKDLFYISLFMLVVGIGGQLAWYFFGGVPCSPPGGNPYLFGSPCSPNATIASFQEMQNISGYMMVIGFILLPAGLFKDGLPSPGYVARVFIGFLLILTVGVAFTGVVLTPSATTKGPPPDGFLVILPGSANPTGPAADQITFSPKHVTVIIGQNNTVQWTNEDAADHTVTSVPGDPAAFTSPALALGGKFVYAFTTPGTYAYYCTFHPGWMNGTITVKQ